jgi:hypothetical protein
MVGKLPVTQHNLINRFVPSPYVLAASRMSVYTYVHTGCVQVVERQVRGVHHAPPSRPEVKEKVKLYLHSPSGPSWPVLS